MTGEDDSMVEMESFPSHGTDGNQTLWYVYIFADIHAQTLAVGPTSITHLQRSVS